MGNLIYFFNMKFAAIAALVATAQAAVGAECNAETPCEETECCGTATPAEGSTAEAPLTICQTEGETEYANPDNEEETYTFACNTAEAAKDSASKLVMSATALVAAAAL